MLRERYEALIHFVLIGRVFCTTRLVLAYKYCLYNTLIHVD